MRLSSSFLYMSLDSYAERWFILLKNIGDFRTANKLFYLKFFTDNASLSKIQIIQILDRNTKKNMCVSEINFDKKGLT